MSSPEIGDSILTPDQPISVPEQDYLERGGFASRLATQLMSYRDDRCLVVAFYAPWEPASLHCLTYFPTNSPQGQGHPPPRQL